MTHVTHRRATYSTQSNQASLIMFGSSEADSFLRLCAVDVELLFFLPESKHVVSSGKQVTSSPHVCHCS